LQQAISVQNGENQLGFCDYSHATKKYRLMHIKFTLLAASHDPAHINDVDRSADAAMLILPTKQ
jgi:hypothetical protein